jgi:MFS family permease
MGALGDRIGLRKTLIIGLLLFAVVYGGIIFVSSPWLLAILFFIYGFYAAATEGISKAWISNIVSNAQVATAIGFYTGLQSICTLIASSFAGWLWYTYSPAATFGISSLGSFLIIIYFAVAFHTE